jgi:phosphotriesterase-related protein
LATAAFGRGSSEKSAAIASSPRSRSAPAIAQRGAFIQFDTIQGDPEYDTQQRIEYVKGLIAAGFEDRVLLSQDVCLRSNLAALGGCGYTYVITGFRERLLDAGLSTELVTRFLVDNPRRALTGAAA